MYYLLGFRIVRYCQETVTAALNNGKINELIGWEDGNKVNIGKVGKSHIFQAFDEQTIRKVRKSVFVSLEQQYGEITLEFVCTSTMLLILISRAQ